MSQDYDNTNSGAMFKNDKKVKDNQPDRKGSCTTKCNDCGATTEFWVSGWLKKSREGKDYMSMAFTAKEDTGSPSNAGEDDDIPF